MSRQTEVRQLIMMSFFTTSEGERTRKQELSMLTSKETHSQAGDGHETCNGREPFSRGELSLWEISMHIEVGGT
jgi:hypothetical protein